MKILLIAKPWKGGLGRYFHLALQEMFPGQVEWIPTRPEGIAEKLHFRRDPDGWWQKFLERISSTPCDAALFVAYRDGFRALKPRDANVLYLIDDVRMAPGDAASFGRVFLSDPGYEQELRAVVSPAQYGGILPFACYPPLHRPEAPQARKGVCFIGNRDAKRDPYLERLFAENIDSLVIGNYFLKSPLFWRNPLCFRPAVENEAMGGIYAHRLVSLNIHARVVREGTNMRTFECAAYGIPQVVEYRKHIEDYFAPEKEILTYRDPDEMVSQIRALATDFPRALHMAKAARKRALAEHTYHHRIASALGHLLPERVLGEALGNVRRAA